MGSNPTRSAKRGSSHTDCFLFAFRKNPYLSLPLPSEGSVDTITSHPASRANKDLVPYEDNKKGRPMPSPRNAPIGTMDCGLYPRGQPLPPTGDSGREKGKERRFCVRSS